MIYITKEQWNELNENQKQEFQKGIGPNYKEGEYPSRNDLKTFLKKFSDYNPLQSIENGGEFRGNHDDTDVLWEKVKNVLKD